MAVYRCCLPSCRCQVQQAPPQVSTQLPWAWRSRLSRSHPSTQDHPWQVGTLAMMEPGICCQACSMLCCCATISQHWSKACMLHAGREQMPVPLVQDLHHVYGQSPTQSHPSRTRHQNTLLCFRRKHLFFHLMASCRCWGSCSSRAQCSVGRHPWSTPSGTYSCTSTIHNCCRRGASCTQHISRTCCPCTIPSCTDLGPIILYKDEWRWGSSSSSYTHRGSHNATLACSRGTSVTTTVWHCWESCTPGSRSSNKQGSRHCRVRACICCGISGNDRERECLHAAGAGAAGKVHSPRAAATCSSIARPRATGTCWDRSGWAAAFGRGGGRPGCKSGATFAGHATYTRPCCSSRGSTAQPPAVSAAGTAGGAAEECEAAVEQERCKCKSVQVVYLECMQHLQHCRHEHTSDDVIRSQLCRYG
jgi:hypothetical protein